MSYYYNDLQNLNDRLTKLENRVDRIDGDAWYFYNHKYPEEVTNVTKYLIFQNSELKKAVRLLYCIVLGLIVLNFYFMIR